ncbi:hypothetical protein E4T56_gene7547 [Termitomyces sp. T112]|nr:hypothetical protein E4T56_gene7547 [Termitomyces sp. T112]
MDHPFRHLALTLFPPAQAVTPAPDRAHRQIKVRRGPPVKRQFGPARRLTQGQRGKIEIAQIHRPLELEHAVPRQEDHRAMRVDPLDIAALRLQKGDGGALVLFRQIVA